MTREPIAGDANAEQTAEKDGDAREALIPREARLTRRLKLYFAMLSCLGGLVLAGGDGTTGLPTVAVFFAVFGYVCVDRLRLFALPSLLAYAVMGLAGLYCISDFRIDENSGGRQILAVAELLVIVQSVMMLQKKTQRIFEQIVVFCLLQLIVAAVFNDALHYGLLLVPIGIVGAWGLSLLASLTAARTGDESVVIERSLSPPDSATPDTDVDGEPAPAFPSDITNRDGRGILPRLQSWSPESQSSLAGASRRIARVTLLSITPAVLLVGCVFFYALPRTTDAARMSKSAGPMVGFNDRVSLQQVGQLLQNSAQALRIQLTDRRTGQPYLIAGPMYLRGKALEYYSASSQRADAIATWSMKSSGNLSRPGPLPVEFIPERSSDQNFFDSVELHIDCEAMRTATLFGIVPYHETSEGTRISHDPLHWTLRRRSGNAILGSSLPRISYRLGTNAFRGGLQTAIIAPWTENDIWGRTHRREMSSGASERSGEREDLGDPSKSDREAADLNLIYRRDVVEDDWETYREICLQYDVKRIPSAKRFADMVRKDLPSGRDSSYDLAKAVEQYLISGNGFRYSLNLDAEIIPGMDPIEQFLREDRSGHCQYFASALAMMLRSQGIPARLVVGYNTDEYNDLGRYYVARQLHAHAWVEALVPADELPTETTLYGQRPSSHYWVRLDATPGGGGGGSNRRDRGVGQVLDIAQNFWQDYVVDMDGARQDEALFASAGETPMSEAYGTLIRRMQATLARARQGELGGGSLASGGSFSMPAALGGVALTLFVAIMLRIKLPSILGRRKTNTTGLEAAEPSLEFYARAVETLSRVDLVRQAAQTPRELSMQAGERFADSKLPASEPFGALTRLFYGARYRGDATDPKITDALLKDLADRIDRVTAGETAKKRST